MRQRLLSMWLSMLLLLLLSLSLSILIFIHVGPNTAKRDLGAG